MPQYRGGPSHRVRPTGATARELETAKLAIASKAKDDLKQAAKRLNPDYTEEQIDTFLAGR